MTRLAPRSSSLPDPWRDQITHVVDDVEAESASYNQITAPRQAIFKVAVVLLTTTLALTFIAFFRSGANPAWLITSLDAVGLDGASAWVSNALLGEGNTDFNRLVMFFGVTIVGFLLLPVAAITLILREPLRDYGLRIRGMSNSWRPYALLFAVSVPLIALASLSPDFQARYPYYDITAGEAWWPYLWLWWLLYAVQFAVLEFFFRGFMVHGLKLRLGIAAIFVMVVPYTMIHFQKPLPEALAAIAGGTVLGFLSLKTGSIWWGVALHIAIAVTMDVLALASTGLL